MTCPDDNASAPIAASQVGNQQDSVVSPGDDGDAVSVRVPRSVADSGELRLVIAQHEQHVAISGPLPPPDILAQYEDIVPGAAARIVSWAEKEQAHRHAIDSDGLRADIIYARAGLYGGIALSVFFVIAALFAADAGHTTLATILAGATIASVIPAVVHGRAHKPDRTPHAPDQND
ncbi:hypothetical protein GCM10011505_19410 [Tistrella bauzanensis]|uniref:DUF2335 domain-containing protein n=1 Tax=Tistrella bauzanensis TaxID=657419 RepID=A0ABQ1IFI7_9PROT|nr:DUF2335 domain-containing protein [Tistrella bauzanensis]GGB37994.1 hypothetical protein GCM10011505_19410 [Tistrella bauzanensis]